MASPAQRQAIPQPDTQPQISGGGFAANDNQPVAANDNEMYEGDLTPPQYTTPARPMRNVEVERGGTVRSLGTTAQVAGVTTQAAGKTAEVTGKTMKAVGKGMDAGGTAMIRAGTAMSSTGVGAIVGVPTIALGAGVKIMGLGTQATGAGVQAAGKAANKAGKVARKGGTKMKRIDRLRMGRKTDDGTESEKVKKAMAIAKHLPGPLGKAATYGGGAIEAAMKRRKVTQANTSIFSTGFSIWSGVQVWIALISLAFLGLAYSVNAIEAQIKSAGEALFGETVTYYIGQAYEYTFGASISTADWLFEQIFGFSLAAFGDPTNWFVFTYFLTVILGWATLLIAVVIYPVYMVNPFMGEGWKWKMGGFLISAFGYLIPGLNILPWFALYAGCVWKNPE